MTLRQGLTRALCERMIAVDYDCLGEETVARTKAAIADGIAVAVAGSEEDASRLARAHVREMGGAEQATVWGGGFRTSVVQAAWSNAIATHVLDFEPMWLPPTHSVSPVLPVAFALAESRGCSGREVVTAVARGMELQGRIQYAGDQFQPEKLRFHPPGVAGVMGAAATAGCLLGLRHEPLAWAFGIAGSRAGALLANIGSMTKASHCGHAAACGLEAALLANSGYTASTEIFEALRGFADTFFPDGFDAERLLAFGEPFRVLDPGLAIKAFPSQFATHWSITAALAIREQIGDIAAVEHVLLRSPVMRYIDRPHPHGGHDGKFSLQYTAAAALLDGHVGIDSFNDERRFRPDMEALLTKIELVQDPAIAGEWLNMRLEIEVTTGGKTYRHTCTGPRGAWGQPPLTAEEHERKLRDCLHRGLAPDALDEVLGLVSRLETLEAPEVKRLCALLE